MDNLSDLLQPFLITWTKSEVKRWFADYGDNNAFPLCVFHSSARGYIDIYNDPFTYVGIRCEEQDDGRLLLTPYVLDDATPAAVDDLRQWLRALEGAGVKPADIDPTEIGIRATRLNVRIDTLKRWDNIRLTHFPKGLTQSVIAELESVSTETIGNDFRRMREHGLLPPLPQKGV